ncbi:hypothetical protein ROD_15311 [Citrobacter rodentium ICC168]|uniref:Transposase n=1 Tax=Citrobacter rodentium (strain ICC168) TaxID=637910 RepID=D2TIG8_CITRI|nr:hypothetical protein ROD_15311 [Citrobacter rodentium ICC168]
MALHSTHSILSDRYTDFGPTLACEKLAELHDVHLSKETVRSLMVKAGLWTPANNVCQFNRIKVSGWPSSYGQPEYFSLFCVSCRY